MENIEIKVREFIQKKNKKKSFENGDNLFDMGFIDSIFALQLVMFVEKEFNIKVSNKELKQENFNTVDNITSTILRIKG